LPLSISFDEAVIILVNHFSITVSIGNINFASRGIYSPFSSVGNDLSQLQLEF